MSFTKYDSLEVTRAWASARLALLGSQRPKVMAEGQVMLAGCVDRTRKCERGLCVFSFPGGRSPPA